MLFFWLILRVTVSIMVKNGLTGDSFDIPLSDIDTESFYDLVASQLNTHRNLIKLIDDAGDEITDISKFESVTFVIQSDPALQPIFVTSKMQSLKFIVSRKTNLATLQ